MGCSGPCQSCPPLSVVCLSTLFDCVYHRLVRYLAWHKPSPGTPKEKNHNWEGVSRIFWGYMDPSKFSKYTVPDADGFDGSKGHQRFVGLCPERIRAEREGPLRASFLPCSCNPCLLFDFDNCEMQSQARPLPPSCVASTAHTQLCTPPHCSQVGKMRGQKTRLAQGAHARPQLQELIKWYA